MSFEWLQPDLQIDGLKASLHELQSSSVSAQSPIHFAHANGFPALSYRQMLEQLSANHSIYALDHRAAWAAKPLPSHSTTWLDGANDLIQAIEVFAPDGVIGVGHSMGAAMTLMAAVKRPDLFKQIILIEPVFIPATVYYLSSLIPVQYRMKHWKMSQRTLKRKDIWSSREAFVEYLTPKPLFKNVSRSVLQDYAQYGLRPIEQGFELTYPKLWEAHNFVTAYNPWPAAARLNVPCSIARAENSTWVPDIMWRKWQRKRPDIPVQILPNLDHIAPLENPKLVADWVLSCIR